MPSSIDIETTTRREADEIKQMMVKYTGGVVPFGGYKATLDTLREVIELKLIKRTI